MNQLFQMLKKDHKEVKGILGQLTETTKSAVKKRDGLFRKLRVELVPHMKAEKAPSIRLCWRRKSREDAMEGVEEHHVSDMVLKELGMTPKGEDQWGAKMAISKELVEHHIKDEQSKVFKSAEEALSSAEFHKIMKQFEQEKQAIKKNLR